MNLYTNGCSYTHGHRDWKQTTVSYNGFDAVPHQADFVWPRLLSSKFSTVINDAMRGSPTSRSVRRTMEFLRAISGEESDWVFVIQLSALIRHEILDCETNKYHKLNLEEDGTVFLEGWHDTFSEHPVLNTRYKLSAETHYQYLLANTEFHDLEMIKNVLLLTSVLDAKNVKYLITSMHPEVTDLLQKDLLINTSNLLPAIEDFLPYTEDLRDYCGHPNEKGHELIAEYISTELEQRGFYEKAR